MAGVDWTQTGEADDAQAARDWQWISRCALSVVPGLFVSAVCGVVLWVVM